ncbi:MAG TPA: AAA family ATPase, partial [Ktedonobacteraceae bacterium]
MTENGKKQSAHAPASPVVYTPRAASHQPSQHIQNAQPEVPQLPYVISLPLLLQQPLAEPGWIVQGLLPVGVSLLAGPPRIDKALLANQLGLSVATGAPFLRRFPTRQGRVLYLALAESDVHVRGRARGLLNDQSSPDTFHVAFQWSPFRQGGLADLEDTIARLE